MLGVVIPLPNDPAAPRLIAALEDLPFCNAISLEKELSQTRIVGQRELDEPAWHWPER